MLVISAYRSTGTEGASLKDKVGECFPPIFGGFVKFKKKKKNKLLTGRGKLFRNFTNLLNI